MPLNNLSDQGERKPLVKSTNCDLIQLITRKVEKAPKIHGFHSYCTWRNPVSVMNKDNFIHWQGCQLTTKDTLPQFYEQKINWTVLPDSEILGYIPPQLEKKNGKIEFIAETQYWHTTHKRTMQSICHNWKVWYWSWRTAARQCQLPFKAIYTL